MPSRGSIGRNLHLCLLKIKRPPSSSSPVSQNDHDRPFSAASTTTLFKNFNSLYDHVDDNDPPATESPTDAASVDFAAIFASRRFFFSSPGRSNSIVDSSPSLSQSQSQSLSPPESDAEPVVLVGGGGVAVPTYSQDPYADFRRSMQEMVEARGFNDVRYDWEYLQELLLCYLGLNPKNTHKFIAGAFADLIVSLMSPAAGRSRRDDEFADGICNIHDG